MKISAHWVNEGTKRLGVRKTCKRGKAVVTEGRIWNRALEWPRKWAETRKSPGGRGRERGADFSGRQPRGTVLNILAQTKRANETHLNKGQSVSNLHLVAFKVHYDLAVCNCECIFFIGIK